jgi:hypothetical protein
MLVVAFGAPSVFSNFGFRLVRAILDVVVPDCEHILTNSADELRAAWARAEGRPIGITCHAPDEEVTDLFVRSGAPMLLFWSSGEEIVADHVRFGTSFAESIIFSSKYLAMLEPIRRSASTTIFSWPSNGSELATIVKSVASAARLNLTTEDAHDILRRLVPNYQPSQSVSIEDFIERRSAIAEECGKFGSMSDEILPKLSHVFGCAGPRSEPWTADLWWPKSIFSNPDPKNPLPTSPIALVGPARTLIQGPYLHLPPGEWVATITFRLDDNDTNNAFLFDIRCGDRVAGGPLKLPRSGLFSCQIPFSTPAARTAVEMRVVIVEGAIAGTFELLNVTVSSGHNSAARLREGMALDE